MSLLAKNNKFVAQLVTENRKPCAFCDKEVDDEIVYGKLYAIGNIQCHYFCVLLSCCLVQKGRDSQGLFGFMYRDILAEVERSKKHKCSYCGKEGATLGCAVSQCRKQFHLPCGRERNAVSMFYGNYKTFCQQHVPKQQLTAEVSAKVKLRKANKGNKALKPANDENTELDEALESVSVCAICYESVEASPTRDTFWPPCCARDAWFHRVCVQRMALSAGKHYFKCPLCNDKEHFFDAVMKQGYYVPDRDAAWELEQNAFAEIYERPLVCSAQVCKCPMGRDHDAEMGIWDVKLCLLCGSSGAHAGCVCAPRHVCAVCRHVARDDADRLAMSVEAALQEELARNRTTVRRGPVMPSRMSLRRTKQRAALDTIPSSSRSTLITNATRNTAASRESLNLKPIRKPKILSSMLQQNIEVALLSPIKLLEDTLNEKLSTIEVRDVVVNSNQVVEEIRQKFSKPKPRSAKQKILNEIAEGLFNNILKDYKKTKEPVIEWTSPKKTKDIEVPQDNQHINTPKKLTLTIKSPAKFRKSKSSKKHVKKKLRKSSRNEKDHSVEIKANPEESPKKSPQIKFNISKSSVSEVKTTIKTPEKSGEFEKDDTILKAVRTSENSPEKSPKMEQNDKTVSIDLNFDGEDPTTRSKQDDGNTSNIISEAAGTNAECDENLDEQSNSTFELPKEFIADVISDDEYPITPSKLKTVDIQKDSSMEISENDEKVTVDLTQMASPDSNKSELKKLKFKFSPLDTCLKKNDLDLESFKNQYLNEVCNFNCKFNHKHEIKQETPALKTVIDFAVDAALKVPDNLKRKINMDDSFEEKKSRLDKKSERKKKMDKKAAKRHRRKIKKKRENVGMDLSFRNKNIKLKIKIRDEKLKVKIKKQRKDQPKKMKQCVLSTNKESPICVKPEKDVVLKKRNYLKLEKSPDNWKQTSLSSFFCKKTEK